MTGDIAFGILTMAVAGSVFGVVSNVVARRRGEPRPTRDPRPHFTVLDRVPDHAAACGVFDYTREAGE